MFAETAVTARRTLIEPTVRRWMALDTDWQSVVCAVSLIGLIVGLDFAVPG